MRKWAPDDVIRVVIVVGAILIAIAVALRPVEVTVTSPPERVEIEPYQSLFLPDSLPSSPDPFDTYLEERRLEDAVERGIRDAKPPLGFEED